MRKSAILVGLAFLLCVSLLGPRNSAEAAGFVDVPDRARKEVNYLVEGKIANGSSATIFDSDKPVTRMEAAAFIGRALQLDGTRRPTSFSDVGSGNFGSGYIQSAVEKGILSGYAGGRFLPYKEINRGEMAVALSKSLGYSFDGSLSGAAHALMTRGISNGMEDGTFGAGLTMKRSDFAVFLARAINPTFRTIENNEFKKTMLTNADNLNVRSGPSTAYASKGKLAKDTSVSVAHSIGNWAYVKSDTVTGFVNTYYLRSTDTPVPPNPEGDSLLSSQTIILDPGHGGTDPGAIAFGLQEKDVVLATGLKVNEWLKETPFNVKMTRSTDTFISLSNRTAFAKNNGGDVFVSIHANAFNGSANGTETYYYSASNPHVADSKLLAEKIHNRMITALKLNNRGVKKTGVYQVLKYNDMPATLAELGFIDHAGDNQKLKSDYWRTAAAKAIYYGILDYYKAKGYQVDALYNEAK
ncbi:N-acetylmuramoyl-L-alanine amidase [Domibacillus epiphyticus]|uniref:Cell wall hydrolase n=1 Tax=Domibacillus epiphyticus TaxID=1714355 RepID=A0A1V2A5P5_9BACI|nr:N-acetylmuramoyl-L-alanine amidase [Domibacillus epiphyticus]OMP66339.1 cell wall hydrolase [Domibacillus epiphyticus]